MTKPIESTAWSLADLYPSHDSPEMQAAFADMEAQVSAFEALRPSLKADISAQAFLKAVQQLESINVLGNRIYSYAGLAFSANTQDQVIQAFMSQVEQAMMNMENRVLFFTLWWKDLEAAQAERLMAESGDYRYWLETMRQFKPYTLSEAEEKIVNIKSVTGSRALDNLYSTITNRYVFKMTVDGETQELTRGEVMTHARSSDPDLRAAAYQELYRVYGQDGSILGQIYQTLVRDWRNENVDLRHFASPLAVRNLYNDIPDEAVDTLLDVSARNVDIFQRYFKLKARWLGMPVLRRYDIYAPIAESDKRYTFGEAADMVLDSFNAFNPRMAELIRRVFDQDHLDSQVRKGKRSGAFCWTVTPKLTPWVLVNYQGRPDDVATLAHELGHAVHSLLASDHSQFTQHATLPLAETASTFGEMMLVDRLLAQESDETVRRSLLFSQVDDSYSTIMRQAYFARFERQAHEMTQQGATVDELSEAYLANLRQQFGDSVEIGDEFRWEWVSIPHIYSTPFYVYAYAFGQLLVLSLYQQFRSEGESFKPRYIKLLSAGGSEAPEQILKAAGIDMRSAAFWQGGFDVVRRQVEQLEALPR
ncbi:MAG TPA: M3 family oligoendopeptidase [Anaerolineales bacterium]|nr:M3 family oligoendopeptidase [Anaerolineales bacterium]